MIEIVLGILALSLGVAGFILGKRMQTTASSAILEERLNQQLLQVEQLNYKNQQLEQINEEQLRRVITLEAELGQAKLAEDKRVQDL